MSLIKWIISISLLLLLTACHQNHYQQWMIDPATLQTVLSQCETGELNANADSCLDARAVKQVMNDYVGLRSSEGQRYEVAEQEFNRFQAMFDQASPEERRAMVAHEDTELADYSQVYWSIQENFAKLIMARESNLAQLKQQLRTLKDQCEKQPNNTALKQSLLEAERSLDYAQRLVDAMLAAVLLNIGSD